ncbi:MAG TPA: HEAT repeat domain-containing protein [Ardenticatenaceae bacterium]|jgi:hypothetical protein
MPLNISQLKADEAAYDEVRSIARSLFPVREPHLDEPLIESVQPAPQVVQASFTEIEALGSAGYKAVSNSISLRDTEVLALLKAVGEPAIKYILPVALEGGPDTSKTAVELLAQMSPPALEQLKTIITKASSSKARTEAAKQLGEFGTRGVAILEELLIDSDTETRKAAVSGLRRSILQHLRPDVNYTSDTKALETQVVSALEKGARDESVQVRTPVAEVLGLLPRMPFDIAQELVQDPSTQVRFSLLSTLLHRGIDESTAMLLVQFLEDPKGDVSSHLQDELRSGNYQIQWEAVSEAIMEILIIRNTGLPSANFNTPIVVAALQALINQSPRLLGQITTKLRYTAYEHDGEVRRRATLVAGHLNQAEFRALVNEKAKENPGAAKEILELLGASAEGDADRAIYQLSKADPGDVQGIAAQEITILKSYQENALEESQASFMLAKRTLYMGSALIGAAIILLLLLPNQNVATVTAISGVVVQAISGLQFYLYGRAQNQLAQFNDSLDRTQRFLLANSICQSLKDEGLRDATRAELVRTIATVPGPGLSSPSHQ